MKPIGKNIIIKTIEEEIKTASGLLLSSEDANQLRYKKGVIIKSGTEVGFLNCLLYTSPSPRDRTRSRMPSSA